MSAPGQVAERPEAAEPAKPRGEFHIPSLDGLRAISFMMVFVAHAGLYEIVPGGFGVTVFFFLSGYLITTLMRLEHQGTGTVSLRDFYLRRALRILPPFYLVLAISVPISMVLFGVSTVYPSHVLALFGHITNYWTISHGSDGLPAGTGVYWSLAVEEHFYLVFPFVFLLLQRLAPGRWRTQGAVLLGLCAAVLLWRTVLSLYFQAPTDRTYLASDTRVDSILFGCALAVGANPMLEPRRGRPWVWRYVLLPLGLAVIVSTFLFRAPWFRETLRYTLQGIGLVPVFVVAMRDPGWGPMRLLNLRPVRRIGVLSYSLYLVHQVVVMSLEEIFPTMHGLARGALALTLALLMAETINRLIEKPCARLRRRLAHATWLGTAVRPEALQKV